MQTETTNTETTAATARTGRRYDDVHFSRQKLRMCVAIERVCAEMGTDATVADVLKSAGMSRRSFYQFFDSLVDACEAMHQGAVAMSPHFAAGVRVPQVPWMLISKDPRRMSEIDAAAAFERAYDIARGAAAYPLTDEQVLEWSVATLEVSK